MVNTVKIGNKSLAMAIKLKELEGWVLCFREHHCRYRGMRDFANLFDAVFSKEIKGRYIWLFLQSKTNHGYSKNV